MKRGLSQSYSKFQWISCKLDECDRTHDTRPESRRVFADTIEPKEKLEKNGRADWELRKHILLRSGIPVITKRSELLNGAKDNVFSLCLFKPTKIRKFTAHEQNPEFNEEEKENIRIAKSQGFLISLGIDFSGVNFSRIPYQFKCGFEDKEGNFLNLTVLDWEMSTLFRNVRSHGRSDIQAKDLTLDKYQGFIEKYDVYFILGTRHKSQNALISHPDSSINPWSIISVIPFPKSEGGEQGLLPGIIDAS